MLFCTLAPRPALGVDHSLPAPPRPLRAASDWRSVAEDHTSARLCAARDEGVGRALLSARDHGESLEALKLLADTAVRTGDWSLLGEIGRWPIPPGPSCACDDLAWYAAILHAQGREAVGARTVTPTTSRRRLEPAPVSRIARIRRPDIAARGTYSSTIT